MEGSLYMSGTAGSPKVGAEAAWRGLSALCGYRGERPTGAQLAGQIARDATASQSMLAVRNFLHEILVDARSDPDGEPVVADVSELVTELQATTLTAILRAESEPNRRAEFVDAAAERLSVPALLRVSASLASALDRPYPGAVRGCVKRLAHRAIALPAPANEQVAEILRTLLRRLFRQWTTAKRTHSNQAFDTFLEKPEKRATGRSAPEAERVVEMAIECDCLGGAVWSALTEVVEEGGVARVIDMVKTAPDGSDAAAAIMKRIGTPAELRTLLRAEPFDGAAVDALLRGMGLSAANVMLEELVESTARLTRRYLMERLAKFGPEIAGLIEGRLKDQRWFVQRNMLALLRAAKCSAESALASKFLQHKDARVRREAVLWCMETPAMRDEALVAGVSDRDPSVLRPALQVARSHMPGSAVPALAKRMLDADFPPEFRVLAINLMARSGSVLALEALLHYAQNGKTLMGKPKIAPKSPEMLAALAAIARGWSSERRAAELLNQARRSRDSEIVAAVEQIREEAAA
jgi:hypothetical protein